MRSQSKSAPAILLAVALGVVAVVLATRAESFVPLFLWSGRPYFANERISVSESVSLPEFKAMYDQIVSPKQEISSDMKYLNSPVYYSSAHHQPEIVVAFVYSQLSSAVASRESGAYETATDAPASNANFQYLSNAVSTSISSFAAASYIAASPISDDLTALHAAVAPHAEVFAADIAGSDASCIASCDALLSDLADHKYIFTNKHSDLIVVKYHDINRNDHCMQRIMQVVTQRTSGDFLAILSADAANDSPIQTSFVETGASSSFGVQSGISYVQRFKTAGVASGVGATNTTRAYPGITKINSSVFWGLILSLIGVIAISCGVCWIQSIETPARFSSTPLVLSKEY